MKTCCMGIDISAKTLDICVLSNGRTKHYSVDNSGRGIAALLKKYPAGQTLVAMENTGRYNNILYEVLAGTDYEVYVIDPLHLKKSMGLTRGKDDRVDAERICRFIERNQGDVRQWQPASQAVSRVKLLLSERGLRIKIRGQLSASQKGHAYEKSTGLDKGLDRLDDRLTRSIDNQIAEIEALIGETVAGDEGLSERFAQAKSVPGVGKVLAWTLMAKTNGFTVLTDPRKLACYAGVVPFGQQSGTSVHKRPRVSQYADKGLKKILHMAALSAVRMDNELKRYYQRKVEEGKNKMSVLNAVRNKIIHRICAAVNRGTLYKNSLVIS
ncbi:MAG: IS110 family transposase [Chitinophagaceae bacterium]